MKLTQNTKLKIVTFLCLLCLTLPAHAGKHKEKWYVDNYCKQQFNGFAEYHVPNGKRIDCMTEQYAIEFGFIAHAYEDIGQSLVYAHKTRKLPGIVFILTKKTDYEALNDIMPVCKKYNIKVWIIDESI